MFAFGIPDDAIAFSYHKKNGLAGILYTVLLVSVVEMFVVDLLVRVRHPLAANVLLVISAFGAIWILELAHSVRRRPILVTHETLFLRFGKLWTLDVPRESVASLSLRRTDIPPKHSPSYLRLAPQPNALLTLRDPIRARGPYGIGRNVTRVGLALDDAERFAELLKTQ